MHTGGRRLEAQEGGVFCIDNVNPASNEDSGNGGNAEIRSSHSAPGGACAANESLRAQGGQGGDASA